LGYAVLLLVIKHAFEGSAPFSFPEIQSGRWRRKAKRSRLKLTSSSLASTNTHIVPASSVVFLLHQISLCRLVPTSISNDTTPLTRQLRDEMRTPYLLLDEVPLLLKSPKVQLPGGLLILLQAAVRKFTVRNVVWNDLLVLRLLEALLTSLSWRI
jgi:hypothetical protein